MEETRPLSIGNKNGVTIQGDPQKLMNGKSKKESVKVLYYTYACFIKKQDSHILKFPSLLLPWLGMDMGFGLK